MRAGGEIIHRDGIVLIDDSQLVAVHGEVERPHARLVPYQRNRERVVDENSAEAEGSAALT